MPAREAKRLPYEFCRYIGAISNTLVGDGFPVPFSPIGTMERIERVREVTIRNVLCTNWKPALPAECDVVTEKGCVYVVY